MGNIELIGSVALIHLVAVISPGPDFLVMVRNSLSFGRRVGFWTAIGIGCGIMIHIFYSFIGLGLLISQSEILYNIVKYLGTAYLIYLGYGAFFSVSKPLELEQQPISENSNLSSAKAFQIGFLTNVLNPKATLFFLSLFTMVIKPDVDRFIFGIISVILVVDTMLWFILLSYLITYKNIRIIFVKRQNAFNKIFGVLLLLMAIKIIFG
ncbi:MAG TPA: amino acid transporter [Saprospirales bacterium]|nr:amino acid transporter [Saprospirales bacterium]HRQ29755.1 LysE family transporter [Saprospiraceae bacterium]